MNDVAKKPYVVCSGCLLKRELTRCATCRAFLCETCLSSHNGKPQMRPCNERDLVGRRIVEVRLDKTPQNGQPVCEVLSLILDNGRAIYFGAHEHRDGGDPYPVAFTDKKGC